MPDPAVALGQLVETVLRETALGRRLAATADEPLRHDHIRWLASLCMLGALRAEVPEASLLTVVVSALGRGHLGGRTAHMRESDIKPLMNAIVSRAGLAIDEATYLGRPGLRTKPLQQEVDSVVSRMETLGPWQPWPGLSRVRGDQRGLCHRLIAGIVSFLRPLAESGCTSLDDLRRLNLVTDHDVLHGLRLGPSDEIREGAVLLEAEPSWGKTRKALAYGLRLWQAGHVDGITWVLPTRRAAAHVYEQIASLLPRDGPLVVLGLWSEGKQSDGLRWFLEPSYRYFAAPIGITTMEQAYKAIRTEERHGYTRAAWLARNLLVVDGLLHADSRNLCASGALMRNQRRMGGHSIGLSSGLDAMARTVVDLFTRDVRDPLGTDPRPVSFADLPDALAQPPAAVWSGTAAALTPSALPKRNTQAFVVRLVEPEDHLAEEALAIELASSRRVLRVCNTNRLCRATALRALESVAGASVLARAGPRQLPITYRSHYPVSDLRCIDQATRQHFDLSRRDGCGLLVATSLVDHALDMSFDVVISDFAPADVLLRRMALLSRGAPASWRPRPEFHVLMPTAETLADSASIYDDVGALERTHLHLTAGTLSFSSRSLLERAYVGSAGRGLQRHLARARWLSPETHMLAFGSQLAGIEPDPMFPQGEPRQRIAFETGTVSPIGIPMLPMWIRADERLAPMQTAVTYKTELLTATTSLDVLAWDGQMGHRLASLGYWCSTDESARENDLDEGDT